MRLHIIKTAGFIVVLATIFGCGKDPRGSATPGGNHKLAEKNTTPLQGVKSFPLSEMSDSQTFSKVNMFFWKKGITADEVGEALKAFRVLDIVDDYTIVVEDLSKKMEADPDNAKQYQAQIDALNTDICTLFKIPKDTCSAESVQTTLGEVYISTIKLVSTKTEFFDNSWASSFSFSAKAEKDGARKFGLAIDGASFPYPQEKGFSEYSSEKGNIVSLNYIEMGGIVQFRVLGDFAGGKVDLTKPPAHLYDISMRRTDYQDKLNRIIYKGDIVYRTKDENGKPVIRRGQIKISNF